LAIDPARIDPAPLAALLLRPGVLRAAAAKLSVRLYAPLLAFLGRQDHAAATVRLIEELGLFSLSLLGEAVDFLRTRGAEARCRERFQELVNTRQAKTTVYGWLAKHLDCYAAWDMGPVAEFPFLLLETLRHEYSGDLLKAANQLQELLTQKEWLKQALDAMNPMQRASWIGRLHALSAERSPLDAKSILARAILLFPELADVPTGEGAAATGGAAPRLTAWRSLKERQAQLARIANEEIPKNSRDIAQARSYGDLSENFEYKAAKEQQRLLLRRQAELEADLVQVRGTDFAEFPCERVGPGTLVRLSYPDGRTEHYAILGEWDQEPELGIISSASRLAQALAGRRTGDTCRVPGADQSLNECRIAEIGPLPETVRRWARGV
jgi:transcription elongation GreA/GreB family factor